MADELTGAALIAATMKDGPNFKQGWSFANALGAGIERLLALIPGQDPPIRIAILARDTVLAVLWQHACYMSEDDEQTIDGLRYNMDFDIHGAQVADTADLALRTCLCGAKMDGFDEYHAHLIAVFSER